MVTSKPRPPSNFKNMTPLFRIPLIAKRWAGNKVGYIIIVEISFQVAFLVFVFSLHAIDKVALLLAFTYRIVFCSGVCKLLPIEK